MIRKGSQQHRVDHAENGRSGTNPEREREHGCGCETGALTKLAESVTKVVEHRFLVPGARFQLPDLLLTCHSPLNGQGRGQVRKLPPQPLSRLSDSHARIGSPNPELLLEAPSLPGDA